MADFYFFTDIDLLNEQQQPQAFGPAGTSGGMDVFNVTSRHTATANPNAYAICKGIVFIQDDAGNPNLVNLIMMPLEQPVFDFPKIKFFIYRGLLKDQLINGNEIAAKSNNDLTRSLWDSQEARNNSTNTMGNPPKEALGIDLSATLGNSISIDSVFYRDNVNFQLPIVNAGWSLGKFTSTGFSLEIMVESIGFDPVLGKVRGGNNLITVATLSGSPTQPQQFEHWHDKEEILNYIDPCAFFGMFYHSKIKVKQSSGHSEKLKGNEVYDALLIKLYNKNVAYLDIRNEYNYSFNYFKNYGNSIMIAFDETSTPSLLNYYRNNWPILTLGGSEFGLSNTSNKNIIRIQIPDGDGDNVLPILYLSAGFISDLYPKEPRDKKKFIELSVSSGYTDVISLAVANREGLANTTVVSGYTKIKLNKRFDTSNTLASSGTVIRARDYLDNIFVPLAMKIPFQGTAPLKSYIYNEDYYIDQIATSGFDCVSKIGVARDNISYIFFSFPITKNQNNKPYSKNTFSLSGEVKQTDTGFLNTLAEKFSSTIQKGQLQLTSTPAYPETTETYLTIENKKILNGFRYPDLNEIIAITFSIADFNTIIGLCNSNFIPKYRVYLGISLKENQTDNTGIEYTRSTLVLRGYWNNAGNIEVKEVSTGIKIYTDGNI